MNLTSIKNLFRAYLIEDKKTLLIMSIIIFAIAALESIDGLLEISVVTHCVCIIFIAGMFFHTPIKKNNDAHIHILPVTACEKLINALVVLLLATVVFLILMVAGTYLGYYCIRPFFNSGSNILVHNGFSILRMSILNYSSYLVFAASLSVFLFGSIYFKGRAMLKTIGAGAGFLFGIAIYFLVLLAFSFTKEFQGEYSLKSMNINIADSPFFETYWHIFPIAIIVFFISLTYLRLRETEV
jgi:hypothetical protein